MVAVVAVSLFLTVLFWLRVVETVAWFRSNYAHVLAPIYFHLPTNVAQIQIFKYHEAITINIDVSQYKDTEERGQ